MTHFTVGELGISLGRDVWGGRAPLWPPDAFAVCASILAQSGAYVEVVNRWPPDATDWTQRIAKIGALWRKGFNDSTHPPGEVEAWWNTLRAGADVEVTRVSERRDVTEAILQLVAAADEASGGVGIAGGYSDAFHLEATGRLAKDGLTLCSRIDASRVRVLPKMRAPQTGITLRSLTGNLALVPVRDVDVRWYSSPIFGNGLDCLNMIVLPWPFEVLPSQFRALTAEQHLLGNLPSGYGFFSYERDANPKQVESVVQGAIDEAKRVAGSVHALVLPELALLESELPVVMALCAAENLMLVTGVAGTRDERHRNYCIVNASSPYEQDKHHRWCLESSQICTYGLGARLNPNHKYWEAHVPSARRCVHFISLDTWLTMSVLLCEDLARQDPVSQLMRAVGPNLVIALLMDGPQLAARWPARYATVLAEDPGSSVLTVSSLGMVELSRVPGMPKSRTIGLWRDAWQGPIPLDLPPKAKGLVLSISRQFETEYLADGRDDGGTAGHARLSGCHALYLPA